MTTPHRPDSRLSRSSGPSSSFLGQLLDKINGKTRTPAISCNSGPSRTGTRYTEQTSQTVLSPGQANVNRVRLNQDTAKRAPSVWVGGSSAAQDIREKLRATDETRLKKTNTLPEEHHSLGGKALPRPRPSLGRLMTQFPAPSHDEVAQSSSATTHNESGSSSTSSHGEVPSSALTASSTNPTVALHHLGSRTNSPHKRDRGVDDTEYQHVSKKMRLMSSSDVQDLIVTANSEPHLNMGFGDPMSSANLICEKAFPDRTVACTSTGPPNDRQRLRFPSSGYNVAIDDAASTKVLQPATPRPESEWKQTSTTPDRSETPETPSWARSFHLVDTSAFACEQDISIYKSIHGDQWAENPLCEYCFRQHGWFSRVLEYGCETCGREKCLRDYYWEPSVGSDF